MSFFKPFSKYIKIAKSRTSQNSKLFPTKQLEIKLSDFSRFLDATQELYLSARARPHLIKFDRIEKFWNVSRFNGSVVSFFFFFEYKIKTKIHRELSIIHFVQISKDENTVQLGTPFRMLMIKNSPLFKFTRQRQKKKQKINKILSNVVRRIRMIETKIDKDNAVELTSEHFRSITV